MAPEAAYRDRGEPVDMDNVINLWVVGYVISHRQVDDCILRPSFTKAVEAVVSFPNQSDGHPAINFLGTGRRNIGGDTRDSS